MDSPSRYATGEGNLVRKSTGKDDGKKNMGMSPLQPPVLHGDASSLTQLPNPNAPKRGLSAYMLFANETREKIREEYPGINLGKSSIAQSTLSRMTNEINRGCWQNPWREVEKPQRGEESSIRGHGCRRKEALR